MCFLLCFFLLCVPTLFFPFVFAKLVMRSFCLVYFCVLLRVCICVVLNQLCMYLLASLFFVFVYAFTCLTYFFQCFLAVLVCFFLPNWSNLHVLFVCRFRLVTLPRFWQLPCTFHSFFLCCGLELIFILVNLICFELLLSLYCFFWLISCLLNLIYKSVDYIILRSLVFVFFGTVVCFDALHLHIHMHYPTLTPCYTQIPLNTPPRARYPSLPPSLFFWACACFTKRPHLAHLGLFSPCFCLPPCLWVHTHPYKPHFIHLHPSTPFFAKHPKTWCPGKFPRP